MLLYFVCMFMSIQMIIICLLVIPVDVPPLPPRPLPLHNHNHQTLLLPHSIYLFFLPCSHFYHIHGNLYHPLWKYRHLWLSWILPCPWRNIMLSKTLGYCHPHQNHLVHSHYRCHHYGGAVDNLSGCQNIICPPACPRWCSLDSIQKLAHFPSAYSYPPYPNFWP